MSGCLRRAARRMSRLAHPTEELATTVYDGMQSTALMGSARDFPAGHSDWSGRAVNTINHS
jgi:hypothetical protein